MSWQSIMTLILKRACHDKIMSWHTRWTYYGLICHDKQSWQGTISHDNMSLVLNFVSLSHFRVNLTLWHCMPCCHDMSSWISYDILSWHVMTGKLTSFLKNANFLSWLITTICPDKSWFIMTTFYTGKAKI